MPPRGVTLLGLAWAGGGRRFSCRRDLGFGQLAPQVRRQAGIGSDRREVGGRSRARAAVVGHQAAIGRDDVAGAQRRVFGDGCIDQAERVLAVAGAARDDLFPIGEGRAQLAVGPAVRSDRIVDAAAAIDAGLACRAERTAGLRRGLVALALNRKKAAVAETHAIGHRRRSPRRGVSAGREPNGFQAENGSA